MGILALTLVRRYMTQQEVEYLTANAEAVARQAEPLLSAIAEMPPLDEDIRTHPVLNELVSTSAFLGNVRVKILDAAGNVLADSGLPTEPRQFAWVMSAFATAEGEDITVNDTDVADDTPSRSPFEGLFVALPQHPDVGAALTRLRELDAEIRHRDFFADDFPRVSRPNLTDLTPNMPNIVIVRTEPSQWGHRFIFERDELDHHTTPQSSETASPRLHTTTKLTTPLGTLLIEDTRAQRDDNDITIITDSDVTSIVVTDAVGIGEVVAITAENGPNGSVSSSNGQVDDAPAASGAIAGNGTNQSVADEEVLRSAEVVTVPIGVAETPIGYVELSNGPDFGTNALAAIRRAFLIAAGAVSLLSAAVGLLVGQGLTAPLLGLMMATDRMSSGDLGARAPVRGRDETAILARQFNQMATQLERSFADLAAERDTLRRFVADASHELRTPITALKTFNELLQGPATVNDTAHNEFLQESQRQIERLEWITANLLDLSRLDAGLVEMTIGEVAVHELLTTTVTPFCAQAHARMVRLMVSEPPQPLVLECDKARLELVLTNLLENALKFTPDRGQVEVGARQRGETVQLWVKDSGAGIAADDLPHIFDRFYRRTQTATTNGQTEGSVGSGLGLAIAQAIVHAHNGTICASSTLGKGSTFTVETTAACEAN